MNSTMTTIEIESLPPYMTVVLGIIINILFIFKILYVIKYYARVLFKRVRREVEDFGLERESIRRGVRSLVLGTPQELSRGPSESGGPCINCKLSKETRNEEIIETKNGRGDPETGATASGGT